MTDKLTRAQLRKILRAIRAVTDIDKATRNAIVCALVGHSRIQRDVGSYSACARCDERAGSTTATVYVDRTGRGRSIDRAACAELTWRDMLYVRDPFKEGK